MVLTPLQRFYSGIAEENSKPTYKLYLDKFFNYAKISHDEFCSYETKDQDALLEQYIFYLRGITDKTGKYQNSYNTIIAPLKLFCTMNNVVINWARLYKMFPKTKKLSNHLAYNDDDIKLFLDVCNNPRDIAFVHFMNSTAVRIGEVYLLNIQDVEPFEDGAIVRYYAGQKEEYRVCLTPEAYSYLKKYLENRTNKNPESPLFVNKKGIIERRLAKSTISELMKDLRYKVNPNQIRDGKRKDKAPNNAFRKRLEIIFADSDVQFRYASYLLDHNKSRQDPHYFRDIKNTQLWFQFKKAIPLITLDKSKQIIAKKDDEIEKLREEYEGAFKEKLESQDELILNLAKSLASTKYLMYEKMYIDCYDHETHFPNLDELRKKMTPEVIEDWNSIVPLVNKPEWVIKDLNNSESRMKHIKELREWKALLKTYKKQGKSKETIVNMEKMILDIVLEYDLENKDY